MAEPKWIEAKQHWRLQSAYNGERKDFYSGIPGKKGWAECKRKEALWILDLGEKEEEEEKTFGELWELYLEDYKQRNKITTYKQTKGRGKAHLVNRFKNTKMCDIKKKDWQRVITDAFLGGAESKATLKNIATTIRAFCRWCAAMGYIEDHDVPEYFAYPAGARDPKEKKILQPHQMAILFDERQTAWHIHAFRFLVLTGLRRGELCGLKMGRDFKDGSIFVREAISHDLDITDGKSKEKNREIVLGDLALREIKAHRSRLREKGISSMYVFADEEGRRIKPRRLGDAWRDWREENGIDLTLQELRHTHISYTEQKINATLDELKHFYGHSEDMDTVRVYVHPIDKTAEELKEEKKRKKEIANDMDDLFRIVTGIN